MKSDNRPSGTGKVSEMVPSLECEEAPPLEKETRFAVVMYGGISLAIYIHGVAQELYHLVRATARRVDDEHCYLLSDDELRGTEKIYRCLGKTLKTKFVVDILSGTSAGGINAVFLAKALVNDRSMEFIKDFWVQQGDITLLVNDNDSLEGLGGLTLQDPPVGLLNSQRFYYKLLDALKEMGSSNPNIQSPYVKELDLNITTTDIRGLNLPITINNNTVNELRYKNVFKFYYKQKSNKGSGNDRNDFSKDIDPFLAFAARCTASIPPAFEAMQLEDIIPILKTETFKNYYGDINVRCDSWKPVYKEYLNHGDDFPLRSFGDGGYLDNKPFSHATETLLQRRADFPVDRKMVYIEPSPEHPEDKPLTTKRPDMLENILAALLGLPRQETIRDDLKAIAERNRVIRKVKHVLSESSYYKPTEGEPEWVHKLEWANKFLMDPDILAWYGSGYITYHQLRVESVLKNLSTAFAQGLGWNENGTEEDKLHELLHKWLDKLYSTHDHEKISENDILFRLDLSYRMRKHQFQQHILNVILLHLGKYLQVEEINSESKKKEYEEIKNIFEKSGQSFGIKDDAEKFSEKDIESCLTLLHELKFKMNNVHAYLRGCDLSMRMQSPISEAENGNAEFEAYKSELKKLKDNLNNTNEAALISLIEELSIVLGTHVTPDRKPDGYLFTTFDTVSKKDDNLGIRKRNGRIKNLMTEEMLRLDHPSLFTNDQSLQFCLKIYRRVQNCLAFYYDNFEYYDMLTFPIQYGTDTDESDEVEVIRISPEDAKILVDERNSGRRKLAGTKLANFGAFFNKEWRENDMLWGRLDAVEILMKELLSASDENDLKYLNKLMWGCLSDVERQECGPKEWNQWSEKERREYGLNPSIDPYNLAFELILQEDLKPRAQSVLYKLLAGEPQLESDRETISAPSQVENISPMLEELLKKKIELRRLEEDLDRYRTFQEGTDPELNNLNERQLALVKSRTNIIDQQIKEEKEKIKLQDQNILTNASKFLQSAQEAIRQPSKKIQKILSQYKKSDKQHYQDLLRSIASGHGLLHYFKYGYEINTSFEPKSTFKVADRSAQVIGRLLSGLPNNYPIQKPVKILVFALQVISALVNFALPKSMSNFLLGNYWIWLVYASEAILAAAGHFTKNDTIKSIAITAFVATAAVHYLVVLIYGWMARRKKYIWWFYPIALVVWIFGIYKKVDVAADIGMFSFGITLAIHAAASSMVESSNTWLRAIKWVFVALLTLILAAIFYLGLVYMGMLPLWDFLARWVMLIQNLPVSKF